MSARAATLAVVAVMACTRAPDDPVFFFGHVQDGTGVALAGVDVAVDRGEGQACFEGIEGWPTRTSYPLLSWPEREPVVGLMTRLREATTGPEGDFLIRLWAFEVDRSPTSLDHCFLARTSESPTGARSFVKLHSAFQQDTVIDPLIRWDASEVVPDASGWTLALPDLPIPATSWGSQVPQPAEVVAYQWELDAVDGIAWLQHATGSPLMLDAQLLEDFASPVARINLRKSVRDLQNLLSRNESYELFAQGAPRPLADPSGPPAASRGARCTLGAEVFDPCPLTDGKLEHVWFGPPPSVPPAAPAPLVFELGTPATLRELVVRDVSPEAFPRPAVFEWSADGLTWSPLVTLPPPELARTTAELGDSARYFRVSIPPTPEPARFVRIPEFTGASVRELSLFE